MQPTGCPERHNGYQLGAEEVAVRKKAELPGSRHVVLEHVQHAKVLIAWLTRRIARV